MVDTGNQALRRIHPDVGRGIWDSEVESYFRAVRRTIAESTEVTYRQGLDAFAHWSEAEGWALDPALVTREQLDAFLTFLANPVTDESRKSNGVRRGPKAKANGTQIIRYGTLSVFFKWWSAEVEAPNPMARVRRPKDKVVPVPVVDERAWARLMGHLATKGRSDFLAVRDILLFRLMADAGLRRAEAVGLLLSGDPAKGGGPDVDIDYQVVTVHGKGDKVRHARYGTETAKVMDRYLRLRERQATAHQSFPVGSPARVGVPLFLLDAVHGKGRPIPPIGVNLILARRCREAGLARLHPHQLRHTWAADLKGGGATDETMMALGGWSSPKVMARYGAHTRGARALDAYVSPLDAKDAAGPRRPGPGR